MNVHTHTDNYKPQRDFSQVRVTRSESVQINHIVIYGVLLLLPPATLDSVEKYTNRLIGDLDLVKVKLQSLVHR